MGQLSQAKYAAALKTPLGDNILVLKSFSGSEELGQPALSSIETVSKTKVGHAVISDSVTSQTLNPLGITLKAPAIVQIQAPMVIITGSLWVQGGIGMGPACMPVS
jgi:hypothetical protein